MNAPPNRAGSMVRTRHARRQRPRHRAVIAAVVLALLAGAVTITAGALGFGAPVTYQKAPVVETPFSAADPDTSTGPETVPVLGPSELAIPSLGIHAHLVDVGLTPGSNAMVIPSAELVGHYTLAAPIGAPAGSTLLAGHVNHADWSPGALWDLSKIAKGAHVYVTNDKGTRFTYRVYAARSITRQPLPEDTYKTGGEPQLVIVTCAGTPGPDGNVLNYDQNTIVTAAPATD